MKVSLVRFIDRDKAIHSIRHTVFTGEQGVETGVDFDGDDEHAIHALVEIGGEPAGTGRMLPDGHIGRVAVLKQQRDRGIGKAIMECLISCAREREYPLVYLYAQVSAVPFYEKLGFCVTGESFMEAGIMHTPMELPLRE